MPVSLDPCGARLTLASEGVELEFRWVIPGEAQEETFRGDDEGDVPMSKADAFPPDTCWG